MNDTKEIKLATQSAMSHWERTLKRPDLQEKDRVAGALLAYQRQLDACAIITDKKVQDELDTMVPLSEDGKSVFIDGFGSLPIDFSQGKDLEAVEASNKVFRETLEWYAERARATKKYMGDGDHADALVSVAVELSLDGGKRAEDALKKENKT